MRGFLGASRVLHVEVPRGTTARDEQAEDGAANDANRLGRGLAVEDLQPAGEVEFCFWGARL